MFGISMQTAVHVLKACVKRIVKLDGGFCMSYVPITAVKSSESSQLEKRVLWDRSTGIAKQSTALRDREGEGERGGSVTGVL